MNFDQSYNSEHSYEKQGPEPSKTWKNPRGGKENQGHSTSQPAQSQNQTSSQRQVESKLAQGG